MTAADISARIDRKEQALHAVASTSENVIAAKSDLEALKNHLTLEGLNGLERQAATGQPNDEDRGGARRCSVGREGLNDAYGVLA